MPNFLSFVLSDGLLAAAAVGAGLRFAAYAVGGRGFEAGLAAFVVAGAAFVLAAAVAFAFAVVAASVLAGEMVFALAVAAFVFCGGAALVLAAGLLAPAVGLPVAVGGRGLDAARYYGAAALAVAGLGFD